MEAVLTETVRLLDEAGEPALTFRTLAARLGGGVGSIYWYVQSKEELLDRAADHVLEPVLDDTDRFVRDDDPIRAIRGIALALFAAAAERPWLSAYFLRNTGFQPNSLRLFERVGGFSTSLRVGEFIDWYARAKEVGAADISIPHVVVRRRLHGTNTGLVSRDARVDLARIVKAAIDRRRAVSR